MCVSSMDLKLCPCGRGPTVLSDDGTASPCAQCAREHALFGEPPPAPAAGLEASSLRHSVLMLEAQVKSMLWAMEIASHERTALELRVAELERGLGDAGTALDEAAETATLTAHAVRDLRLAAADATVVELRALVTGVKP